MSTGIFFQPTPHFPRQFIPETSSLSVKPLTIEKQRSRKGGQLPAPLPQPVKALSPVVMYQTLPATIRIELTLICKVLSLRFGGAVYDFYHTRCSGVYIANFFQHILLHLDAGEIMSRVVVCATPSKYDDRRYAIRQIPHHEAVILETSQLPLQVDHDNSYPLFRHEICRAYNLCFSDALNFEEHRRVMCHLAPSSKSTDLLI